jgi:hypothetical protein
MEWIYRPCQRVVSSRSASVFHEFIDSLPVEHEQLTGADMQGPHIYHNYVFLPIPLPAFH